MTNHTGAESATIPDDLLGMSITPGDRHVLAGAVKVEEAYSRAGLQQGDAFPGPAAAKRFGLAPETPDKRLAVLVAVNPSRAGAEIGEHLLPLVREYRRWRRLLRVYEAEHPERNGKVLLHLADGCGKAGQKLLRAIADSDANTPAGCSSREPREDRKETAMTMATNEALKTMTEEELAALAVRTDERSRDTAQPVAVALEVAEILAELADRAGDFDEWKFFHAEYLPWGTARSDFLLTMYRQLPDVPHGKAMQVLSAVSLQQAAWLLHQTGALGEFLRLPEPREGKLLRCTAGDGAVLVELIPDVTEPHLFHLTICDRIKSRRARRRTWGAPQNWEFATGSLSRELEPYAADYVLMIEADAGTAVLTPRAETVAAN